MVNPPKARGTSAETAVVRWLRDNGHPHAERRALAGAHDLGDITGIPGICIEVKAGRTLRFAAWMRETDAEQMASGSNHGILVVKPVTRGASTVGRWWAVMYAAGWMQLMAERDRDWYDASGGTPPTLSIPGSRLTARLRAALDQNPDHAICVAPPGNRDPDRTYVIMHLEELNRHLRLAGYGTPL